jgi:hypothetical protein
VQRLHRTPHLSKDVAKVSLQFIVRVSSDVAFQSQACPRQVERGGVLGRLLTVAGGFHVGGLNP